jgi:hypothetical protein
MKRRKRIDPHASNEFKVQHWISRRYSRQWVTDENSRHVNVFSHNGVALGPKFSRGLFKRTDMYTRFSSRRIARRVARKGLRECESRFGTALPKIERKEVLSTDDAGAVLAFAVRDVRAYAQDSRARSSPMGNVLRVARDFDSWHDEARSRAARTVRQVTSEKRRNVVSRLRFPKVEDLVRQPLQSMFLPRFMETFRKIGELKMSLSVFTAAAGQAFVTSDAPCIFYDERIRSERDLRAYPGMESPTFEIDFPLSPRLFLVLSNIDDADGYFDANADVVKEFNRRIVNGCHEYFVALQERPDPIGSRRYASFRHER